MRTVIVRLADASGDGQLHGVVEVVGSDSTETFADDGQLLSLLRTAGDTSTSWSEGDVPSN